MALDRITLTHFRNHAETRLEGTGHFNLLVGENGAGKTNVLEAISLLAPGRGLRRAALAEVAMAEGSGRFAVHAELDCGDGADAVSLATGTSAERPGRRIVQVNSASTSALTLGEWLGISWLTPAMDRLFADSAGARRRFMDRLALSLDPAHASHAARHEKALGERNRLLSGDMEPDPTWLDGIETQLAEAGAALAAGRERLVATLGEALAVQPEQPFARPTLAYAPGGPVEREALAMSLREGRKRDRAVRRTLVGPHRDELEVTITGKGLPAAACSTGEQKAMLIAIILAHAGLATRGLAVRGRPTVLLLDEVAAHLDPVRRATLFARLRESAAQIWMTGTELAPFAEIAAEAAIWRVADGTVERIG